MVPNGVHYEELSLCLCWMFFVCHHPLHRKNFCSHARIFGWCIVVLEIFVWKSLKVSISLSLEKIIFVILFNYENEKLLKKICENYE